MKNYEDCYSKIVNNHNLTMEKKKILLAKLVQNITRATKRADKQIEINKYIEKIDLDKVATFEMFLASLFPLMGVSLVTWGLGSDVDQDLYNKMVDIMMNPVLGVSVVGSFTGLVTTIFQDSIKKKIKENVEKTVAKKESLENVQKDILIQINNDEIEM